MDDNSLKLAQAHRTLALASYNGQDIQSMCPECVTVTDGTEIWAMKAENLQCCIVWRE